MLTPVCWPNAGILSAIPVKSGALHSSLVHNSLNCICSVSRQTCRQFCITRQRASAVEAIPTEEIRRYSALPFLQLHQEQSPTAFTCWELHTIQTTGTLLAYWFAVDPNAKNAVWPLCAAILRLGRKFPEKVLIKPGRGHILFSIWHLLRTDTSQP